MKGPWSAGTAERSPAGPDLPRGGAGPRPPVNAGAARPATSTMSTFREDQRTGGVGRRCGEWPSGIQLRCFGAEQGFAFRPSACSLQKPGNPGRREMPPHARAPLRWSWRAAPRGRVRPTARPPAQAVWPLTAGPGAPHRRPRPPSCPPQRPSLIAAWGRSAAPTSAWNLFLKELFKNHFFFPARDGGMPDHPGVAGRTSSPQGTARTAFIETLSRRDPRGRRARRRLTLASRIRRHYFS